MADAATGTAPVTTPAEPQAPAGSPPSTAPETGAPSSAEGGSAQPAKPAEPSDGKPAQLPWSEFRKVQNENKRYQAELKAAQDAARQHEAERAKWQAEQQQNGQIVRDYRALQQVIQQNPDLADQLEERIGKTGTRATAAATGLPKEFLDEFKAMREQVATLSNGYTEQQKLQRLAAERQETEKFGQQLRGQITSFLTEKKYSPKLAAHAEAYLLERVRQMGGAEMEDVPLILNDWYADQEENRRAWVEEMRAGAQPGKTLPPVPGGGSQAPITGRPDYGALDGKTARVLEQELKDRLGWGKQA